MRRRGIFAVLVLLTAVLLRGTFTVALSDSLHAQPVPDSIVGVKERHEAEFLAIPGVTGVGIGICDRGACIKVYVEECTPELELLIPRDIEGFAVVIEMAGPFEPLAGAARSLTCSSPRAAEIRLNMMVELDVFSGRPNPSWNLSSVEVAEFVKLVTGLPPSRSPMPEGGLGYRGFLIHRLTSTTQSVPEEVRVYNGIVRVTEGGQVRDYEDSHQLERWLKEQARQRGYGDILN